MHLQVRGKLEPEAQERANPEIHFIFLVFELKDLVLHMEILSSYSDARYHSEDSNTQVKMPKKKGIAETVISQPPSQLREE